MPQRCLARRLSAPVLYIVQPGEAPVRRSPFRNEVDRTARGPHRTAGQPARTSAAHRERPWPREQCATRWKHDKESGGPKQREACHAEQQYRELTFTAQ